MIHEYLFAPCVLASIAGGTLLDAGCDSNHLTQLCVVSWMVYNVHEMTCNIQYLRAEQLSTFSYLEVSDHQATL